jgi:cytochrome b subunit of formate dehydrogenase
MWRAFDHWDLAVCFILSLLAGIAIGFGIGVSMSSGEIRREAVRTGVARYVAAEDGGSKFEWIVPSEKKP